MDISTVSDQESALICIHRRTKVLSCLLRFPLLFLFLFPAFALAGQPYLVSDGNLGNIWRIEDINGDGDALDVGERTLWATGGGAFGGMQTVGSAVYAVQPDALSGNGQIVRFMDLNGDGDALDAGERTTWAEGFGQPVDIARDPTGSFYVTDAATNAVWRLVDANNDGDALDVGERALFADAIDLPLMLLPRGDDMLVSAYNSGEVILLTDIDGDGDALDAAERSTILSAVGGPTGLHSDGSGGLFVSSINGDTVYQAIDHNADGDYFDVAEVLSYADGVFGAIDGPWNMTDYAAGGILVADYVGGRVSLVRDMNGDGDALDIGEVVLFADGIGAPVDIVALLTDLSGDFNRDGTVDAADYVLWRSNPSAYGDALGYMEWVNNFGQTAASGSAHIASGDSLEANDAVPEPAAAALLLALVSLCCVRWR